MKLRSMILAVSTTLLITSSLCWGQTADNAAVAEALFQEAQRLINEGRVHEACGKFVESDKLDPGLGTKLSIADCYEREGKLATAWAAFTEVISLAQQAQRKDRETFAKDRADALAPRVPKLVLVVQSGAPNTVQVLRDGLPMGPATFGLPLPIDPGDHVISARAAGFKGWSTPVNLPEGKTVEVNIPALEVDVATPVLSGPVDDAKKEEPPAVKESTNGLRTGGVVVMGFGLAGLVAFGVTGGLTTSKVSDVETTCPNKVCPSEADRVKATNLWHDAQSMATVTTVGLGVSGAVALTGLVMAMVSKSPGDKARERRVQAGMLAVGSSGAVFGVKGAF